MTFDAQQGSREEGDGARTSELLAQIVEGKLDVKSAWDRHGLSAEVIHEGLRQFRRSALLAFDEQLQQSLVKQGATSEALVTAEFTGTLADISIADLIQTIQIAGKDALMTITVDGQVSRIWCCAGAIVDAESGRLTAEAAVYRILNFEQGRVVAELRSCPRVRAIHVSTHGLLLEAARHKDESVLLWRKLGDAQQRYRLAERATGTSQQRSPAELSLLRLFDPPCSLTDVLSQSELGDLETLTTLTQLVGAEYLVEAGVSLPPYRSLIQTQVGVPQHLLDSLVPLTIPGARARPPPFRWRWAALGVVAILPLGLWFQWPTLSEHTTRGTLSASLGAASAQRARAPVHFLEARVESHARESLAPPRVAVVLSDETSARDPQRSPRHEAASVPKTRASDAVPRTTSTRDAAESSLFVPILTLGDELPPRPERPEPMRVEAAPKTQIGQGTTIPTW
ncbi:MAG: DUF4388 domain-containing protein [Deltaproteobacteria bacterium]